MSGKGSRGWETSAAAMPTSTGTPSELSVIESFLAGMKLLLYPVFLCFGNDSFSAFLS